MVTGEVKLITPIQSTVGAVNGNAVPVFRIYFTVRGEGAYSVMVPQEGYTPDKGVAAVMAEAKKIIDTLDAFL